MPDSITPVGAMINPPDPMQGIRTMSGILGIQQQRQNLQTGQYQQAQAQAESQQSQQKNMDLQRLEAFTQGAIKDPKYQLPDGSPDIQSFQRDAMVAGGVYGQPVVGQMASNFKEAVETRRALQQLSSEQNASITGFLKGIASKPGATSSDLLDAVSQARSNNKDVGFNRALDNFLLGSNRSSPQEAAANGAAILGGITRAQPATNAASQIITRDALTNQLSPATQAGVGNINPSAPQVAGATTQFTGSAGIDVDRANQVGAMQQPSSAGLELTKEIDRLADDINSGHVAKMISETGNYFGMSSINEARSKLNKDLGQVRGAVAARAGSDAKAGEILQGYPTDTTPPPTIHGAMDYVRGTFRQNIARAQLLKTHGQQGFAEADNLLTGTTDPLMHEFMALDKPEDRIAFYRRNFQGNGQAMQQFKNRVDALKKHTTLTP
jgi:hypothetical protein